MQASTAATEAVRASEIAKSGLRSAAAPTATHMFAVDAGLNENAFG